VRPGRSGRYASSVAEWWTDDLSGRPSNLPLATFRSFTDSGLKNSTAFAGFGSGSHTAIVASTSLASTRCEAEEE